MVLRIVNDDPRCRSQQHCHVSNWKSHRGICNICSREAKMERAKAALEKRRAKQIPDKYAELYQTLIRKVGATEARRVVDDHVKRAAAKASA